MPASRTIIFSDLHLRHAHVDEVLVWEGHYDKVICLGDYFDQFNDTPEQSAGAACWLKRMLADPRNVMLLGNHDMQYVWPNHPSWSWGHTPEKAAAIHAVLTDKDVAKLRPYHVDQGILFSHAGFDERLPQVLASHGCSAPTCPLTLATITAYIDMVWDSVSMLYSMGRTHPLLEPGSSRGGIQRVGGITWEDLNSHQPVAGVGQICGHSIQESPLFRFSHRGDRTPMWRRASVGINPRWLANGWTLGLDCNSKWYAVLEGDILTLKRVQWSRPKGSDHFIATPTASSEDIVIHLKEPSH
jgi:hypothetical protein